MSYKLYAEDHMGRASAPFAETDDWMDAEVFAQGELTDGDADSVYVTGDAGFTGYLTCASRGFICASCGFKASPDGGLMGWYRDEKIATDRMYCSPQCMANDDASDAEAENVREACRMAYNWFHDHLGVEYGKLGPLSAFEQWRDGFNHSPERKENLLTWRGVELDIWLDTWAECVEFHKAQLEEK